MAPAVVEYTGRADYEAMLRDVFARAPVHLVAGARSRLALLSPPENPSRRRGPTQAPRGFSALRRVRESIIGRAGTAHRARGRTAALTQRDVLLRACAQARRGRSGWHHSRWCLPVSPHDVAVPQRSGTAASGMALRTPTGVSRIAGESAPSAAPGTLVRLLMLRRDRVAGWAPRVAVSRARPGAGVPAIWVATSSIGPSGR